MLGWAFLVDTLWSERPELFLPHRTKLFSDYNEARRSVKRRIEQTLEIFVNLPVYYILPVYYFGRNLPAYPFIPPSPSIETQEYCFFYKLGWYLHILVRSENWPSNTEKIYHYLASISWLGYSLVVQPFSNEVLNFLYFNVFIHRYERKFNRIFEILFYL